MRKAFLAGGLALAALVVLVFGTVTYVLFNIDALVKDGIEEAASKAFKVPVTVAEATMSLKSGNGQIVGLRVPNPPGFTSEVAMHFPLIEIRVNTRRAADESIAIESVVIQQPKVVFEIADGRVNLKRLRASTKAWRARSENEDEDAAKGQKLAIERVTMQNGALVFRADFLAGETFDFPMPDTRIKDVGTETNGTLPAVVIDAVTEMLLIATERASRRIDLGALAAKTNTSAPDVDLSALLKE